VTSERARELLSAERDRIARALADVREPTGAGEVTAGDDAAQQASDLYEREFEGGLRDRLLRELEALERAEARLVEGTYGLSVESGEPIPDERLEAFPLAERTVEEERRVERGA
jgi:DnaK suppressor protein